MNRKLNVNKSTSNLLATCMKKLDFECKVYIFDIVNSKKMQT